jgi:hypothetical protein
LVFVTDVANRAEYIEMYTLLFFCEKENSYGLTKVGISTAKKAEYPILFQYTG